MPSPRFDPGSCTRVPRLEDEYVNYYATGAWNCFTLMIVENSVCYCDLSSLGWVRGFPFRTFWSLPVDP